MFIKILEVKIIRKRALLSCMMMMNKKKKMLFLEKVEEIAELVKLEKKSY